MPTKQKTIIVTGASQGIGAAIANLFLNRGYNVGTSRHISSKNELRRSEHLALVDGDISQTDTAQQVVETAAERFGSVDALVNNAGIFFPKPFLDYTTEDFRALSSTNLEGFIYITQLVVKQMLSQKSNGSIVSITATIADHPLAALTASVPMITKGGINAISRSLAMEYAKQGIRAHSGSHETLVLELTNGSGSRQLAADAHNLALARAQCLRGGMHGVTAEHQRMRVFDGGAEHQARRALRING
jgi:NAD(P)-dependent dehydrogenase (short-subunit alcohol dehydrogenase family)